MSATPTSEQIPASTGLDIPLPPSDLPFDDGEPLESNLHRHAMNTLIRSLEQAWADRNDFFTGGNMFIYFSTAQVRNQDFRGPDFFAVLDVDGSYDRQSWIVWEEGGRYPDVIEVAQQQAAQAQQRTAELEAMLIKYRERFGEPTE